MPRAEQDALLAAIPDARLVVYNGAGHSPNWEQPERVARDIEAFLRRCQRSRIAASRATRSASTASVSGNVSSAAES